MTPPTTNRFPAEIRDRLADADEIEIETWRSDQAPHHRTIIWPVVDDAGRVLVRSVRGTAGRWFREAVANPNVVVHLDGQEIAARALLASDAERIAAASQAYRSKYAPGPSVRAMVKESVLATTLELVPG